jgi:hypothetical protein
MILHVMQADTTDYTGGRFAGRIEIACRARTGITHNGELTRASLHGEDERSNSRVREPIRIKGGGGGILRVGWREREVEGTGVGGGVFTSSC